MSWLRMDDKVAFHAKTLAAGNEAFGAWTRMGAHVSGGKRDGFIDETTARLIAGKQAVIDRLIRVRFLEPEDGGFRIHDYHDYNPTAEQVEAKSQARAQAGRKGGLKSVEAKRQANAQAIASDDGKQTLKQTSSDPQAIPSHPIPSQKKPRQRDVGADADPSRRSVEDSVFDHWRRVMRSPRSALDKKRRDRIAWALETYGFDDCIRAIDGCAADPFSMGDNDRGTRFNDPTLIFRDAAHVEKFIDLAPKTVTVTPVHEPAPDPHTVQQNLELRKRLAELASGGST